MLWFPCSVWVSQIIKDLEKLRNLLTKPNNIRVHMAADVSRLVSHQAEPNKIWREEFLPSGAETSGQKYVNMPDIYFKFHWI
jgi:hypothetical protein